MKFAQQKWVPWNNRLVLDAEPPAFALRTYIEQVDVRAYIQRVVAAGRPIQTACEIGCGYGRMIVVLGEFAEHVVGFERQPEFVSTARRLHRQFEFHQVEHLGELPAPSQSADLVLTFTVLQHLTDHSVARAINEIKRILRPLGNVLICEDTNAATPFGDVTDETGICVVGRTIETYAKLFAPLRLVATSSRRVEPTCPHKSVGDYMLFQGS